MAERLRLRLACDLSSPARARHRVVAWLKALGCLERLADAALIVSELVTNAVLHGGTDVELAADYVPERLWVQVADHGHGLPSLAAVVGDEPGGRGLHIVAALSEDWGTDLQDERTTVWCSLAC